MSPEDTFRAKAPAVMDLLMKDFSLDSTSAAAILGNIGHECLGFTVLQEISPTVKGSKGGYGWCQWTGPRRTAFEAYCKRNDLDPASDKANYGFLFVELTGTEAKAIPAVKKASGLDAKVEAFELAFLRAGAKNYASRDTWAGRALDAWLAARPKPVTPQAPSPATPAAPEATKPPTGLLAGLVALLLGGGLARPELWWLFVIIAAVAAFVIAAVLILKRKS